MLTAEDIIRHFNMKELPDEGGFFVETYRADEIILQPALPARYQTDKAFGTAILYLLTDDPNSFSALHKLPTDEIYHFYRGDPIEMLHLYPDGSSQHVILGHDILNGQQVQYTVQRNIWQGSQVISGGRWGLIGTTMAPGFGFEDYIGGVYEELIAQYPHEAELIRQLTR